MENNKQLLTEISISKELESSFIDYAMSVIVSRAIPDIRDGLKPVHRRILYAMNELGMLHNTAFKKSARVVGEVIAKYHPHGDSAVYESLVRMAQPFSLRYTLVKGQGNFGSVDGDSAAAMRYTEAKLEKISNQLLEDLNKETVSFVENYDGSEREPTVLPAKIPNLLLNGSTGIAVGMATSIPPHNLTELTNAIIAYARNHNITIDELLQIIPGPDFPTGGSIVNKSEMSEGYYTGRGRIVIRSKTEIEYDEKENRGRIIITEIPYMVTKSALILRIAELVKEKIIESISDIRDESNRKGIRVVIFLKRGYIPEVELNKLFKLSQLQTSFAINMLTLVNNKPEVIDIKKYIQEFLHFQIEILVNKTKFQLNKSEARKHILEGLSIALSHINEVIEIIKQAKDTKIAQDQLMTKYSLSEEQAKSILDMKLSRLTSLERTNMQDEINNLLQAINGFNKIINSREVQIETIIEMLEQIKNEFGDERKTEISFNDLSSIEDEDLIPNKDIVITLSSNGYIKRIPVEEYRTQGRGGMGSRGATTYDDDFIRNIIVANTHTDILFFTSEGRVFKIRGHAIPEMGKNSKGIPVLNLIDIAKNEKIMAVLPIKTYENMDLMFLTKNGIMKKTIATEYQRVNKNGKIAINLREQDQLLNVIQLSSQTDIDILIGNSNGKAVRFKASDVRAIGRSGTGVIGMDIDDGKAIDFGTSEQGDKVLAVSSKGFGKLTSKEEYRLTKRGSKGVFTISTQKSGDLVGLKLVKGDEDLMVVTDKGTTIRLSLTEVSELSRNTKGVKIINIKDNEKITSLAVVPSEKAIEEEVQRTIEHRITLETELKEIK